MLWFPLLNYKEQVIASLCSKLLYFTRNLNKNGPSISTIHDSICFSEIISVKILRFKLKEALLIYLRCSRNSARLLTNVLGKYMMINIKVQGLLE